MTDNYELFAEEIRRANKQGPPQETCKVFIDGKLRDFSDKEFNRIKSDPVYAESEEPRDIPLYGRNGSGWVLSFRH